MNEQDHNHMTAGPRQPQEIGGTHYQQGLRVSPWDLQAEMKTSGIAFVDARRADVLKYTFRLKDGLFTLLQDLKKARHCLDAGIEVLERQLIPRDTCAPMVCESTQAEPAPEPLCEISSDGHHYPNSTHTHCRFCYQSTEQIVRQIANQPPAKNANQ